MTEKTADQSLEYIEIQYLPGEGDPARIFRSMAKLIDAVHQLDKDLARSVSVAIEPILVLERVESGSIRAVLRRILRQIDDDSLRNLDWRPLIGQYLVKGKHRLLGWISEHDRLGSRDELSELQNSLTDLVPVAEIEGRLLPAAIPADRLLEDLKRISDAVVDLERSDEASYVAGDQETIISQAFGISDEEIEALLTDEIIVSDAELALLIKKPDYLGTSRWEFRFEDRTLEAKVTDEVWLERFHQRAFPLTPGDALRARVRTEVNRGFEGNVVGLRYFVDEVMEVIQGTSDDQINLLSPGNDA